MDILSPEARYLGQFIRAKREQADFRRFPGLPSRRRHVGHLTQGELAELVGVSTVVISQIEQSRYPNVTAALLRKIATALRFSQQQQTYLMGLLQPRPENQADAAAVPSWVNDYANQSRYPVLIVNPAFDVVAHNDQAQALFGSSMEQPVLGNNVVRLVFLEPGIREFITDWESMASSTASGLKMFFADDPSYRDRIETVAAELVDRDEKFREYWEKDDPLTPATIEKEFRHPELGILKVNQILTDIVEVSDLTKIDFLPVDDETRAKLDRL